ncbi:MAG: D-tyrosyl-tRNA(Tyr) deacylase [Chlorobia bacterium]|nr:D-tyrosyl-tRNA(Tyr) deacylase [Fimbriimonadaceae bacterium]
MRAVVQRVSSAAVGVGERLVSQMGIGLALLIGVHRDDAEEDARKLADRVVGMRIFNDADGKINLALKAVEGQIMAVSNFTVYGDASQRRPSFGESAGFEKGKELFDKFVEEVRNLGVTVHTGEFGSEMQVAICNEGPVTLIVDTR